MAASIQSQHLIACTLCSEGMSVCWLLHASWMCFWFFTASQTSLQLQQSSATIEHTEQLHETAMQESLQIAPVATSAMVLAICQHLQEIKPSLRGFVH